MKTLQEFMGRFKQALENTIELAEAGSIYNSSSISGRAYPYPRGIGRALTDKELVAYQTPLETFKKIGEGFQEFAVAIQTLAEGMDEINKRLAIVEVLVTLGDDKQIAIEEKIRFIVSEVKRLVDAYIEEEMDAHLIGRKINWKIRCSRGEE